MSNHSNSCVEPATCMARHAYCYQIQPRALHSELLIQTNDTMVAAFMYGLPLPHNRFAGVSRSARRSQTTSTQRRVIQCCASSVGPISARETAKTSDSKALTSRLRSEIVRITSDERGLFGTLSTEKEGLEALISEVEASSSTIQPTADSARAVAGTWRLLYTTMTIMGRRRVALAIATPRKPGFVNIAEITQQVLPGEDGNGRSISVVNFKFLTGGTGSFSLDADYFAVSNTRVDVTLREWTLEPQKVKDVLGANVDLLLEIFNPEGYLDIGYVDEELRIGRDHKGHIFVLEKVSDK